VSPALSEHWTARDARFAFVAYDDRQPDRDGDVILVRGIDTRDFQRNPVMLADHDKSFVLGRVTSLYAEARPGGDVLKGTATILPAGTSTRVDEAWTAITHGARAGISIGFLGEDFDGEPVRTGQRGLTFRRTALLEISSVSVPSCATCVSTVVAGKGLGLAAEIPATAAEVRALVTRAVRERWAAHLQATTGELD